MDLKSRRKLIRTILPDDCGDITSDGRTVWVNMGVCVARFCPSSRDYIAVAADDSRSLLAHKEATTLHPEGGPSIADWIDFFNEVNDRWGILVGEEHTPLYIQRAENVSTAKASPTP